ncbi:metalloregulator ArsR/SmtB family transcription factor [Xenorhabdus bovienii]|uniref:ArsR/SmtB family transcription factor n=1 Tax=Xenorhabdus bovienii TaxID=40576 RepID=UPI0030B9D847
MKTINRTSHALSEMADFAKTLGHSHRLTLVEAIFRHESSVEHLAEISGLSITNTSQHLQQLRRAGFVQTRREGKHVLYRIGDGPVANILAALRDYLAYQQTEIQRVVSDSIHHPEHLEGVSIEELLRRQEEGVLLLDVRSEEDYAAGHIPGAINIPTEALVHHLEELPRNPGYPRLLWWAILRALYSGGLIIAIQRIQSPTPWGWIPRMASSRFACGGFSNRLKKLQ